MTLECQDPKSGAKYHRGLGQYPEAVALLTNALESEEDKIPIAIELGETLRAQGYASRAVEVLENNLPKVEDINNVQAAAGTLLLFLARFEATARFKADVSVAARLYEQFSKSEIVSVSDDSFRLLRHYCTLLTWAHQNGDPKELPDIGPLAENLVGFYKEFLELEDFENALLAAMLYHTASMFKDVSLIEDFVKSQGQIPSLCVAKAQVTIASQMDRTGKSADSKDLLEAAQRTFQDVGHRHGVLDLKIKLACRFFEGVDDKTFHELLQECKEQYSEFDHPAGLLGALQELARLASKLSLPDQYLAIFFDQERISKSSGLALIGHTARSLTLGVGARYGNNYAKVIEAGSAAWFSMLDTDCARLRSHAAHHVAMAYDFLLERRLAIEWWDRALQDPCGLTDMAIPSWADRELVEHPRPWSERYEDLQRSVEMRTDQESSKLSAQAVVDFVDAALSEPPGTLEIFGPVTRALELLERFIENLPLGNDSEKLIAKLRDLQACSLTRQGDSRLDYDLEDEANKFFDEAKRLYLKLALHTDAMFILQKQGLLQIVFFQKLEALRDVRAREALQRATNVYEVVFNTAKDLGHFSTVKNASYWVAHCQFHQWQRGWLDPGSVLASIRRTDGYMDEQRQELTILPKVEALALKRHIASTADSQKLYRWAIYICLKLDDAQGAWEWVQKSKARSLSDFLGLFSIIPKEVGVRIANDADMSKAFAKEVELLQKLSSSSETARFELRTQLAQLRIEMKKHRELEELLKLRGGDTVTRAELQNIVHPAQADTKRSLTFVDWVITQGQVFVLVTSRLGEVFCRDTGMAPFSLRQWATTHLRDTRPESMNSQHLRRFPGLKTEDDENDGPLRELDPLVAPLAELCEENELLVLCPTGVLHSLPLHALRLGPEDEMQVLLRRNPIVYCASLTAFSQCCRKAQAEERPPKLSSRFLAVYESERTRQEQHEDDIMFTLEEQRDMYNSTEEMTKNLAGDAFVGRLVTPELVKESLQTPSWLQFIGHCDFDPAKMNEQSLEVCLSDSGEDIQPLSRVTVDDLLNTPVKSRHVSLLGCGTAVQDYTPGDEPLGLISALLAAGASSVLGTQWPIEPRTALEFSTLFHSYLNLSNYHQTTVYDLAGAVRAAVLDMSNDFEFRNPYHWAAFVLHGSWYF